jgi:hypothetical protein
MAEGGAAARSDLVRFAAGLQQYLPDEPVHMLMALRRRRAWRKAGIIFIHVPKAAGTSIAEAIYGRTLGHMRASTVRRICPRLSRELPTFAVVRNPWDRLVSAYHYAAQGGTAVGGMRHRRRYRIPAFRSFPAFLEDWFAHQRLPACDFVFQPQHLYVCNRFRKRQLIVDFVGRVERMEEVCAFLETAVGKRFEFGRSNASGRDADYRRYYSAQWMVDLVGDRYRQDIELFGYDF